MSAPNDLAIQTSKPVNNNNDDDDASEEMPLSPASVKSYEKNKSRHSKKSKDNQPFSEEDDSDDFDEASYESDKKSDSDDDDEDEEGAFNVSHLNARLEAMDGTTKLKTHAEKKKEEEEEEDDEDDSSNDDDNDSATNVQQLGESVAGLRLGTSDGSQTSISGGTGAVAGGVVAPGAPGPNSLPIPSIAMEGEFYQDPTSPGGTILHGQEERLQEPVKPHIALPCLVETAKNPARTRITLKYSGSDVPHQHNHPEDMENKASTRGRKNYMVATDLSGESWHATEWAITTLLRNGDEINVVTIVEDDTKGMYSAFCLCFVCVNHCVADSLFLIIWRKDGGWS